MVPSVLLHPYVLEIMDQVPKFTGGPTLPFASGASIVSGLAFKIMLLCAYGVKHNPCK